MNECNEYMEYYYRWGEDKWLLHVAMGATTPEQIPVVIRRMHDDRVIEEFEVPGMETLKRFIITRESPMETAIVINHVKGVELSVYEILDRAHFPSDSIYNYSASDE